MERIMKTCIYCACFDDLRVSERNYPICEDCNFSGNDPYFDVLRLHLKQRISE